jgi:hypothetical protein
MDASQITKLLQKQNTRYINRSQTVDSSTLTWQNQIQSSKYIKGVKTCEGQQNTNVPTNPCCADQVSINGQVQNTGTYSFGGSGRTTALQTGSPQHYLNVLSGASGSASQVYSSESITLQKAGKESCGVPGVSPAPQNSYVVLPGGNPLTSNAQLQVPSCSYICTDTNGPVNGGTVPVNNQSNPYLPPFDTYYAMKNPQCNYPVQDQNQKHFVKQCIQCPGETPVPIAAFIPNTLYTIEPPSSNPSISYNLPQCPIDQTTTISYPPILSSAVPIGGVFTLIAPGPGSNPATINSSTGLLTIPEFVPNVGGIDPSGTYIVTYSANSLTIQVSLDLQGC